MDIGGLWQQLSDFVRWLGINPTEQDAIKAGLLIVFALVTLMVLGDIYRGEVQNTLHRVRLIKNPANDVTYRTSLQLPKRMISSTLDGVFTNVIFYYRYRDHRGRIRTRRLTQERAKFRVRSTFPAATAAGHEKDHIYTAEERIGLAKEMPDLETSGSHVSEIVAMAHSKVDLINEQWNGRMARADDVWSKLSRSKVRRFFAGVKEEDLQEPEKVGLVVKFHFPINPYFLLYKHPESNVRSTAWLTVLTSLFAIFMQLVYTQRPVPSEPRETTLVRYEERAASPTKAGVVPPPPN